MRFVRLNRYTYICRSTLYSLLKCAVKQGIFRSRVQNWLVEVYSVILIRTRSGHAQTVTTIFCIVSVICLVYKTGMQIKRLYYGENPRCTNTQSLCLPCIGFQIYSICDSNLSSTYNYVSFRKRKKKQDNNNYNNFNKKYLLYYFNHSTFKYSKEYSRNSIATNTPTLFSQGGHKTNVKY